MSTTSFDLLTPLQQDLRMMVHKFADEEIIPTAKVLEIEGEFPAELYKKAYEMGLTTMILPEKFGGMGLDIFTYAICKEELARGDAGLPALLPAASWVPCQPDFVAPTTT